MKIHEWFSLVYPKKEEIILGKKEESKLPIFGNQRNQNKEMKESNKQKICFNLKVKKLSKISYIENYVYEDCINSYVYVHMRVCTYSCTCIHKCVCMYMHVCKCVYMYFQNSQGIEELQTFK